MFGGATASVARGIPGRQKDTDKGDLFKIRFVNVECFYETKFQQYCCCFFLCLYDLKLFLKKQLATQRMIFPWLGILPRVQTAGPTILRKWNIPQKSSCLIFGVQIRTSWLTESIVHFWRIQGADGRRFYKWFKEKDYKYCVRPPKLYWPTTADGFDRAKNRQRQIKRTRAFKNRTPIKY